MSKATVMVVDDNVSLRKTMFNVLKHRGYNVIVSIDGRDAISKAKENPDINLVFMDIKMPVMNGVEALKQIKRIIPKVIVVMMTAYAVEELVQESLEEGAYGVLYKPLDLHKIVDIIEKARSDEIGAAILVVDDDLSTRTTFEKVLKKKGYDVITTDMGEKAVTLVEQEGIDIIFIDMKLPTINGLETYLQIKKRNPNATVILITGFGKDMGDLVDEALISSCVTCMYKPVDMWQVLEIIENILLRKRESV